MSYAVHSLSPSATYQDAIALHWPEYLMEGVELGLFMLSASIFGTLLFYVKSPAVRYLPSSTERLIAMGVAMGLTAIGLIRSPLGRRSGAHFNPAVSITFWLLRKMHGFDAMFYIASQFVGGALGVFIAKLLIGAPLESLSVRYVVTVPGSYGVLAAFISEFFMGWLTMTVVLFSGNKPRLARFTWLHVGILVTMYVIGFSAISGFSVNPARTLSSAIFAGVWTAI